MKLCGLFIFLLIACSCAPGRFVKPLQEKQLAFGADFGGPLIGFAGLTIPVPLTNINVGYGLTDRTTAYGGLHTTALAYGTAMLDVGVLHSFLSQQGLQPGLSGSAALNNMYGLKEGGLRVFPQLDLNAYWDYGARKNRFLYLGLSNWFELAGTRAHQEEQPAHWLPSLQLGNTFVRERWDFTIELKHLAFNQVNKDVVVVYKGPGNKGAGGVYFSVRRKF